MILQVERDRMTASEYAAYYPVPNRPMELIDGEVYMAPSPEGKHQRIVTNLGGEFYVRLHKTGKAKVFFAPFDVHLSENDVLQPDILVIRNERADQIVD